MKNVKAKKTAKKSARKAIPPLHEDQIKADDIRARLAKVLEPVCLILDEATMLGFATSFHLKETADGKRTLINGININRRL